MPSYFALWGLVIICLPVIRPLTPCSFVSNTVFFIFPKSTGFSFCYNSNILPGKADLTIHSKVFTSHLLRRDQCRTHHFLWIINEFEFFFLAVLLVFVSSLRKLCTSTLGYSVEIASASSGCCRLWLSLHYLWNLPRYQERACIWRQHLLGIRYLLINTFYFGENFDMSAQAARCFFSWIHL